MPRHHLTGYLLIILLFLSSCSRDEDLLITINEDQAALESRLLELYGSASFLILPDSDNFSHIPVDANNPITAEKVFLGQMLFHETGLALNAKLPEGKGTYSCSSCHIANSGFQSGRQQGIAEGGLGFGFKGEARVMNPIYHPDSVDVQPIRVPTVLNSSFQQVVLWNGQFGANGPNQGTEANWTPGTPREVNNLGFDGLETQAIAGLSVHRMRLDSTLVENGPYKEYFDNAFPQIAISERYSLKNAGLSIAAYVRTILANESPFQKMLKNESHTMRTEEIKGARLFFGKARCYECHSGPGMNGMNFHALGMNDLNGNGIIGLVDETTSKGRGGFTNRPQDDYKFKIPTLYNLRDVEFYGHGSSFSSIREVIQYKNEAISQNSAVPQANLDPKFQPLGLTEIEIDQLTAFIENALHDPNLSRYVPDQTPMGSCFPNADAQSKFDLGCD
ncbi:MAG: cytochrome-c peroxidase [Eudoraea sp.]|nr:cytochrome-c peroxidase [Eudoraea sp.]